MSEQRGTTWAAVRVSGGDRLSACDSIGRAAVRTRTDGDWCPLFPWLSPSR